MDDLLGFTSPTTTMHVIGALVRVADGRAHPGPAGGGLMTDTGYEARVLTLPVERTLTAAARPRRARAPGSWRRSARGTSTTGAATPRSSASPASSPHCAGRRWSAASIGCRSAPARCIVVNARRYALAPVHAALVISRETGRTVRFVGRPDVAPVGALARRLGGLLARPDEVAGALRAGELLVMAATATVHPRRVGRVDHRLIGAAVETKAAVFPTATASSPWSRSSRIEVGPAVRPSKRRRGPLIELEMADLVEQRIQRILDEFGGTRTGTPLDWLPLSGMGGS